MSEPYISQSASSPESTTKAKGTSSSAAVGLKLKRGTEIVDRDQHWLVRDFIPDDSLIIVAGQVGLGKTTGCMDWAAYERRSKNGPQSAA